MAKYDQNWQIVWVKQKTIENKSLPLWNNERYKPTESRVDRKRAYLL